MDGTGEKRGSRKRGSEVIGRQGNGEHCRREDKESIVDRIGGGGAGRRRENEVKGESEEREEGRGR